MRDQPGHRTRLLPYVAAGLFFGYVGALFGGGLFFALWSGVVVLRAHPSLPGELIALWLCLVLGVSYLVFRLTSWLVVELIARLCRRLGHDSEADV
jgi:hypothetical protein